MSTSPRLSVVVPLLNEAKNVGPLCERLFATLDALELPAEVVAVDDGSTDETFALLEAERRRRGPRLRVLRFARNFGQHAAVLAGFEAARGEWIVTIDADLQNPPEEIAKLVEAFAAGHDQVNTVRQDRQDTLFRRLASKAVNALTRRFSGIELHDFGCMLRGYHRDVVRAMTRRREFGTFIPALGMLYARNPVEIPVRHAARAAGRSNYSLWRLFRLQLDLVTGFSLAPLRLLFGLGLLTSALGIGFGLLLLVLRLAYGPTWAVDGVFTLFAVLFFLVGAQFIVFGVLGEYIGRIYQEVRERPTYLLVRSDSELDGASVSSSAEPGGSEAASDPEASAPDQTAVGQEVGTS
ncbi:MAG: glycosyltransferase [Planctomycetota bacterium]|nr:MAG: glycosyltransferase [Planctomycetota bacterium]